MSTNWMTLERALARAERRLVRRLQAHAWLIHFHRFKRHHMLKSGRKWSIATLKTIDCPIWYNRRAKYLVYDEVWLLAVEAETLVLRLRALKYHGSVAYLDVGRSSTLTVRDFLKVDAE